MVNFPFVKRLWVKLLGIGRREDERPSKLTDAKKVPQYRHIPDIGLVVYIS